mmetsp:Transcript_24728/g.57600  ORF Transcript_24728/g.57600 Transcript_24728/m.57600 type:complete len:242 (-) Transcript_24728:411-1136(-)
MSERCQDWSGIGLALSQPARPEPETWTALTRWSSHSRWARSCSRSTQSPRYIARARTILASATAAKWQPALLQTARLNFPTAPRARPSRALLFRASRLWRARPVSRSARCCLSWYSHSVRPPRQRPILRNRWPFQVGMRSPSRSRASPTRSCSSPTNPSPPRPAHAPSPPLCPSRRRRQQQLQLQRQQQQHRVSVTAVPRELARRWLRRSLQQRSAGRLSEKRWRANSAGCARRRRRTRRC